MKRAEVARIQSRLIQPGTAKAGAYTPLLPGQTVCTARNEKGDRCQAHVKQWLTAPAEARKQAAPGNTLHRCQRCYTIYEGPPQQYLHPTAKKERAAQTKKR